MKLLHLSFFLVFLFTSCDEESETQAELTAKKLKADISSRTIETISVLSIYDATPIFVGSRYEVTSDGFIIVTTNADSSATFNLGELKSYLISAGSLNLYY
jgi:hypothetical protein